MIGATVRADGALAFCPPHPTSHTQPVVLSGLTAQRPRPEQPPSHRLRSQLTPVAGRAEADAVVAARAKGLVAAAGGARGQRALVAAPAGGADALAIRAGAVAGAVAPPGVAQTPPIGSHAAPRQPAAHTQRPVFVSHVPCAPQSLGTSAGRSSHWRVCWRPEPTGRGSCRRGRTCRCRSSHSGSGR